MTAVAAPDADAATDAAAEPVLGQSQTGAGQSEILATIVEGAECDEFGVPVERLSQVHDLTVSQVGRRLAGLLARGYVRSLHMGRYAPTEEGRASVASGEVITSGPVSGRRAKPRASADDSLNARLWRAMKRNPRFTLRELLLRAAKPSDGNPRESGRKFIRYLKRADYLAELPRRQRVAGGAPTSNGEKIFWLKEYTGPKHPRVRKSKAGVPGMYDANLHEWRPFLDDETGAVREPMS